MPKIPTFQAQGSIEQLAGTTTTPQIRLNQTLSTALAPATKMIVDKKIIENNSQNQAEALKLENDYITDLIKVEDTINTDEIMSVNKDAANKYYKDQSNLLINKYKSLATNNNVSVKFSNYALKETQKGIFRTDTQISKNIFKNLVNGYDKQKQQLLITADTDESGIAKATLITDLEKLTKDTFQSQVSAPELKIMLDNIPGEIELYDATVMTQQEPKNLLNKLKDPKQFSNISYENRIKLINEAKSVLIPQIKNEYENFLAAASFGKDVFFDINFAKEVLPTRTFNTMMKEYKNVKDTVRDVKTLNTISNKNLSETLDNMLLKREQSKTFIEYQKDKKILVEAVNVRNENMASDPIFFLNATNDNIKILSEELENISNPDLKLQKKKALTEIYVETQLNMGQPPYQIKVMSNSEASGFVEQYVNGDQNMRIAMLQNLDAEFGDYNSNAMLQLTNAGLPVTAELSSFFNNPKLTERFLSFDSKDEQDRLKQYAKDNNITFNDVRKSIRENLSEFEDVVMRGSRFNTSVALDKMDNIVDVLSYYALNEMVAGESQGSAEKNAYNLINNSFEIQDTFFVPLVYNGKSITSSADFIVEKANLIKDFYVEDFGAVAFESVDEDVTDIELNEAMKDQLKNFGEWRNSADGTGIVYGIVFNDGSFGPVKNQEGEYLSFNFDNTSLTIPGTNKEMDLDIRTKSQQIQPRRGYPSVSESVSKLQANKGSEIIGRRR